jgi:hypothetical protein
MAPTFNLLDRTLVQPCPYGSKGTSEAFTPLVRLSSIREAPLWTLGQASPTTIGSMAAYLLVVLPFGI